MPSAGQAEDGLLESSDSAFLRIPPELRLAIYKFALLDTLCVTIGHAEVVGKPYDIHHLDGDDRKSYPGLPQNHVPVIASTFDSALLSATGPATIPASDAPIDSTYNHSTHRSLLLVNRQINEELTSHFKFPKNRQTSVFASYPYGLHILKTTASQLLEQAQSVHIAGLYVSTSFSPSRAAYCASLGPPITPRQKHNGDTTPNSTAQLGQLVASSFGPDPIYHIRKLEMRIYYPGVDSYSTVWGDDDSPTVVALRSISNAEVGIEVWRGAKGTGIYLAAKPASERKRVVSTVWRKLEEGRGDDPKVESWVVDPKWPRWDEEYDMSEGPQGNVFTSVPDDHAATGASGS